MKNYTLRNLVRDIWLYVHPYRVKFWIATVVRAVSDLAWLFPPYAFASIVDFLSTYQSGMSLEPVFMLLALTFLATSIRYVGQYTAKTLMFGVSERVLLDAQLHSIRHMFLLDMVWHEKESSGARFKRVERGAASMDRILRIWINNLIEIVINLVGIVFILFQFDLIIGFVTGLFLMSYYVVAYYTRRKAVRASQLVHEREELRSGILFESISNIRSVKAMAMGPKVLSILSENARGLYEAVQKRIFWFQAGNNIRNFYAQLFLIGALLYIVLGIAEGAYTVGFLVLFSGYFRTVWSSMSELADVTEDFAIAKIAVERLHAVLATPVVIDDDGGKVPMPRHWEAIEFKDVSFAYGDAEVLAGVNFRIARGERVGIVGLSGAGKSTLFKLLLKEREEYQGEILFDGVPLRSIKKSGYFKELAVVLQETELFNAPLRDNVTITNAEDEKNEHALSQALEISHVSDFVGKLPSGLDTVVGEKGVRLSGGEKQRVGIARAIFKQPKILLLDEATSHLDVESEEKIQDSLHMFFKQVTAVVIAHRLSTLRELDRIMVLDKGAVVEEGSFAELIERKGRFYELWEKQKL